MVPPSEFINRFPKKLKTIIDFYTFEWYEKKASLFMFKIILLGLLSISILTSKAQSDIKINNTKINHLDNRKRKQGDWIFFDKLGNVRLSCVFKDDSCVSPLIFYENNDTAFIKLPIVDSTESFILYKNKRTYFGSFIYTSDGRNIIEIEPDPTPNDNIILEIKKYQTIEIEPTYFFSQKKIIDYISASFISSNIVFNKTLSVLLTINSSGLITNVEFPRDKNNLSGNEERELHWIYSTMPRWQPLFYKNSVREAKIMLSSNSTLSVLSFDH